jgi:serine protease inhibitor
MACHRNIPTAVFVKLAAVISWGLAVQAFGDTPVGTPVVTSADAIAAAKSANGNFAVDLYLQLSKEHPGKNLFCSPSSVSTALAIAANGAVGETAQEIGRALRFPDAARNRNSDTKLHPWNSSMIDSGLAALAEGAEPMDVPQSMRDRIAKLRADLDTVNRQRREHESAMHFSIENELTDKAEKIAEELNRLYKEVDQYELRNATALWVEKTFPIGHSFLDATRAHFGNVAFPVDFRENAGDACGQINSWVEKQTDNRIKDLVSPAAVGSDTRLVITSAVYFNGQWETPFDEGSTQFESFLMASGVRQSTLMMNDYRTTSYGAFRADGSPFSQPREIESNKSSADSAFYPDERGFTMIELPYKGDKLAMTIIVPQSADRLGELERKLTYDNLQRWIGSLQKRFASITIPRFKLEADYDLSNSLKKLGMVRAFNDPRQSDGAQFDDLVESQDPVHKLSISGVSHKAFVEVNEKGTEAAAVTSFTLSAKGMVAREIRFPFVPIFRADKPFIFLIREANSGCILFIGRVVNPR